MICLIKNVTRGGGGVNLKKLTLFDDRFEKVSDLNVIHESTVQVGSHPWLPAARRDDALKYSGQQSVEGGERKSCNSISTGPGMHKVRCEALETIRTDP